jgi:hypothetical protein
MRAASDVSAILESDVALPRPRAADADRDGPHISIKSLSGAKRTVIIKLYLYMNIFPGCSSFVPCCHALFPVFPRLRADGFGINSFWRIE